MINGKDIEFNTKKQYTHGQFSLNVLFSANPKKKQISDEKWRIVDRLLLEKISLAGIARAVSISKRWIQEYVKKKEMKSERKLS